MDRTRYKQVDLGNGFTLWIDQVGNRMQGGENIQNLPRTPGVDYSKVEISVMAHINEIVNRVGTTRKQKRQDLIFIGVDEKLINQLLPKNEDAADY